MSPTPSANYPRWFVRGDIDGLLGLALDTLITILLLLSLCRSVLGFSDELLIGTVLPAVGLSVFLGNIAYTLQAWQLDRREHSGQRTALPYGVNTLSLLAYVFLVMLPVKLSALGNGLADDEAAQLAWQAGLMACLGSGLIEAGGAYVVGSLRRWLPRAALLSSLAGIALAFLSLGFLLQIYASPLVGLTVFVVLLIAYFGSVRFPLPGGLVAFLLGLALAWSTGLMDTDPIRWQQAWGSVGLKLPQLHLVALWQARDQLLPWLSVIVPMGLFNVVGSMQNIESAEAAGDRYPMRSSLLINGIGTIAAAAFGSCFPTTIYIGHPGWKYMGARIGYSWINGVLTAIVCFLGLFTLISLLVPLEAGLGIIVYIGMIITVQSLQATPRHHAPAVVLGIMVGLAGWGAYVLKIGLRVGAAGNGEPFGSWLLQALEQAGLAANGLFSLEQGSIISAMLLSALLVYVLEQEFLSAALVAALASLASWFGVIHAWQFTPADTALKLGWGVGGEWAFAYGVVALLLVAASRLQRS